MPFPVDLKFIEQAEEKLGVNFPDSFRAGMSELNGGEIETDEDLWQIHPFFDTSDKKRLRRTANDIVRETASAKDWTGFPDHAVAIASGQSGDIALLLPDGDDKSSLQDVVYAWDHETGSKTVLASTTEIWLEKRS
ncbi:MAG: SMI1/KNR4 family protein [Verrucomicrobiota bacterium]